MAAVPTARMAIEELGGQMIGSPIELTLAGYRHLVR
jgi:hypothetical protein